MNALCEIRDLEVTYFSDRDVQVLRGVSLDIHKGEIVGLAGESGCGKSTFALALTRLLPNGGEITAGEIRFLGTDITKLRDKEFDKLRWTKISLVTQSAMNGLNPVLSVGEQIVDAIASHQRIDRSGALSRARELLRIVEVDPERVRSFPHELSGGMRQRVMIAMALAINPELIVMDEPTTALDVVVQAQIIYKLKELQKTFGFSVLFITHDIALLLSIADRVAIMYAGEIVEIGTSEEILTSSAHPYAKGLIHSFPSLYEKSTLNGIGGSPPSMINPPSGCKFHPRCQYIIDGCKSHAPKTTTVSPTHSVACHLFTGSGAV